MDSYQLFGMIMGLSAIGMGARITQTMLLKRKAFNSIEKSLEEELHNSDINENLDKFREINKAYQLIRDRGIHIEIDDIGISLHLKTMGIREIGRVIRTAEKYQLKGYDTYMQYMARTM